jgi:hypothetical protein
MSEFFADRIERLERRQQRLLVGFALAVVAFWFRLGQAQMQEPSPNSPDGKSKLVLAGGADKNQAIFLVGRDGTIQLEVHDRDGKTIWSAR